jgi:excisionase family DNA binding protein
MTDDVPNLLSLMEVATALSVSTHTVRSWVRSGRLRPVRLCRRLLFHPDEVRRLLDAATLPTREEISLHDGDDDSDVGNNK